MPLLKVLQAFQQKISVGGSNRSLTFYVQEIHKPIITTNVP